MRPSDDLSALARELQDRREAGGPPLILFLGQELAAAAGVPSLYQIARDVFLDPDLKMIYLRDEVLSDRDAVLSAFDEFLGTLSAGQRYNLLLGFYHNIPVPAFYQNLALLVKAGYFAHILTTNIDNLLEQALISAGLVSERDFRVLTLGQSEEPAWRRASGSIADLPPISIIKLHGDLSQRQAAITKVEIDEALRPQRYFIKGEISGDMVMVGYRLEAEPLNEWLAWVPGDLWWVAPDELDETLLRRIESSRPVRRVEGESSRPEVFFEQLSWLLLRTPTQEALDFSASVKAPEVDAGSAPGEAGAERGASPEVSDAAYLESQLQRSRSVLQALRQSQTPGEKDLQLASQIEYQQRQITELENRLLNMTPNRERLLDLMKTMRRSVTAAERQARVDPNAAAYMRKQVNTVQSEYRRDLPNQSIVAAAVSATVLLAERLGEDVIDPALVQKLAVYAPSSLGGRL